jgi:Arc/MetJ-type ribon-helix-helix transcriptional regulator
MSMQIAVRIPTALAERLDGLVTSGAYATRADAVRAALEALLDAERRADVGRRIVDGYRRIPQDDAEVAAAEDAASRSIEEEPW